MRKSYKYVNVKVRGYHDYKLREWYMYFCVFTASTKKAIQFTKELIGDTNYSAYAIRHDKREGDRI